MSKNNVKMLQVKCQNFMLFDDLEKTIVCPEISNILDNVQMRFSNASK